MKLHKLLLPNEQQDDNSNNNKIPTPRDKWRQGVDCNFFGILQGVGRELRNILQKDQGIKPTPPPPRLPTLLVIISTNPLISVHLYCCCLFVFSGWMWCYRVWAFKELCSFRNRWKREWHGSFHFYFNIQWHVSPFWLLNSFCLQFLIEACYYFTCRWRSQTMTS